MSAKLSRASSGAFSNPPSLHRLAVLRSGPWLLMMRHWCWHIFYMWPRSYDWSWECRQLHLTPHFYDLPSEIYWFAYLILQTTKIARPDNIYSRSDQMRSGKKERKNQEQYLPHPGQDRGGGTPFNELSSSQLSRKVLTGSTSQVQPCLVNNKEPSEENGKPMKEIVTQ